MKCGECRKEMVETPRGLVYCTYCKIYIKINPNPNVSIGKNRGINKKVTYPPH